MVSAVAQEDGRTNVRTRTRTKRAVKAPALPPLIWMPHPGHFICAPKCQFRLNTWVRASNVIVSTVGEYYEREGDRKPTTLGATGLYETMVFPARERDVQDSEGACCPYVAAEWGGLESERYDSSIEAFNGHHKWLAKYMDPKNAPKLRARRHGA